MAKHDPANFFGSRSTSSAQGTLSPSPPARAAAGGSPLAYQPRTGVRGGRTPGWRRRGDRRPLRGRLSSRRSPILARTQMGTVLLQRTGGAPRFLGGVVSPEPAPYGSR